MKFKDLINVTSNSEFITVNITDKYGLDFYTHHTVEYYKNSDKASHLLDRDIQNISIDVGINVIL